MKYIKRLLYGLLLISNMAQSVPIISRDRFSEEVLQRVSELTGLQRSQIDERVSLKDLEKLDPEIRRNLVEFAREMFNVEMDENDINTYTTIEQAIDYMYQFAEKYPPQ